MLQPPGPVVPGGMVSQHVSMSRATCPLLSAAALGAARPCGVSLGTLLLLAHSTTASPLWLELRGHSAWQATPSWTVYRLACHWLLPWLRVTFAMVPDAAWPGSDQWPWSTAPETGPEGRLGRPSASDPWGVGSFLSLGRPTCVRCPGPLGSCSPVCLRGLLCCVCGVLGHLAPVHRCGRSVCCVACAVSWATWLPFTGVPAGCVVLRVQCPGPLGSCSPVPLLGVLLCVCGVLGHLAPVHRCAGSVCCVACAVFWAPWLLFTGVPAWFVVLCVRCPGPLGSCSPVCPLGGLCCVCGVLGHLALVHRCCTHVVCCVACAVSWATLVLFTGKRARCVVLCVRLHTGVTWLLFNGVPARCVFLHVRCPGYWCARSVCCFASAVSWATWLRSPVCPLRVSCCVCGVLGHLAPVHRCARVVCCVVCAVSWATWLLFTGVPVLSFFFACAVSWARWLRCARLVCCFACAVSWATWLPFTGVPARRVVLCVRYPGPLGSLTGVPARRVVLFILGLLAPVCRCARLVCCVACAVSLATWLPFTGAPAPSFALLARCPGPLHTCSPVCLL